MWDFTSFLFLFGLITWKSHPYLYVTNVNSPNLGMLKRKYQSLDDTKGSFWFTVTRTLRTIPSGQFCCSFWCFILCRRILLYSKIETVPAMRHWETRSWYNIAYAHISHSPTADLRLPGYRIRGIFPWGPRLSSLCVCWCKALCKG